MSQTIEGANGTEVRISHYRPLVTLTMRQHSGLSVDLPAYLVQMNKDQLAQLIDSLQRVHEELSKLPPIGVLSDDDRKKIAQVMREQIGAYDGPRHPDGERIAKAILGETK